MRCIRSVYGFQSEREIYFASRRVLCRFLAAPRKTKATHNLLDVRLLPSRFCCLYELLTRISALSFIERLGHFSQLLRLLISIDSVSDFERAELESLAASFLFRRLLCGSGIIFPLPSSRLTQRRPEKMMNNFEWIRNYKLIFVSRSSPPIHSLRAARQSPLTHDAESIRRNHRVKETSGLIAQN